MSSQTERLRIEAEVVAKGNGFEKATRSSRKFKRELRELRRTADTLGDELRQVDRAARQSERGMRRMGNVARSVSHALTFILLDALLDVGRALVDFFKENDEEFRKFDHNLRQVFTLIPGLSNEARQAISDDARIISVETGFLTDDVLPALYQAISLGISPDNAFAAIRTAAMAARGGATGE